MNDQYLYNKDKTGDSSNTYWECVERRSDNGCGVGNALDQDEDFFLHQTGQHTHPPNPELKAVEKMRTNMKSDARNADLGTNNIVSANIATEAALAQIPELETVCRDV